MLGLGNRRDARLAAQERCLVPRGQTPSALTFAGRVWVGVCGWADAAGVQRAERAPGGAQVQHQEVSGARSFSPDVTFKNNRARFPDGGYDAHPRSAISFPKGSRVAA